MKVPTSSCMGLSTSGHTYTSSKVVLTIPPPTSIMSHHLPSGHPILPPTHCWRRTFFILLISNPNGGASVPPLILPAYPPVLPYSLTYAVPSLVSIHIYLIILILSLGPNEASTVFILTWIQRKIVTYSSIW